MSAFCFDSEVARVFGVEAAVMLWNLDFWVRKNEANGRHFHDGRYWTYNSAKAFTELFPFWSSHQISRILNKLEDAGIIIPGNYNTTPFDRTKWYAIDYDELEKSLSQDAFCKNAKSHFAKIKNGNSESVNPIPNNNADINPDSNQIEVTREARKPSKSSNSLTTFDNSAIATWEKFSEVFGTDEYAGADIRYYYDTIKDWAAAKGARYKDWIAFVRNWMRRDFKEGKLVRQKPANGLPGNLSEDDLYYLQMMHDDGDLWAK